ncbi:acetate--CoA ligase family protein [Candidatus Auribacterota bacterium]
MLNSLFKPKSVAIVGASLEKQKVGYAVMNNMISYGFEGEIFPINLKGGEMMGRKVYKSFDEIGKPVDLAVFVIPPKHIIKTVKSVKPGTFKSAVIISAGFKEIGPAGIELENELKELMKEHGVRTVGPNCLGILDMYSNLNASFGPGMPCRGNIAFFSQSGALGTAVLDWAVEEKIGFSKFISLGNKMDLNEVDMLEALADDPETDVILGYVEGITEGRRFIDVARKVSRKKPVIITKSGTTAAGARAISSHTGTLAGSDNAFKAAFDEAGVIRAASIEELFDFALAFSYQKVPQGDNLVIVTNAGGPGIIAADAVENSIINMAKISKDIAEKLKKVLPPTAALYNPVDIIGDARDDRYRDALAVLMEDEQVDCILTILTPQAMSNIKEIAEAIVGVNKKAIKPLFTSFIGGKMVDLGSEILNGNKVPNYLYPERAVLSIEAMLRYKHMRARDHVEPVVFDVNKDKVRSIIDKARSNGEPQISESDVREILSAYGIPIPETNIAKTADDAVRASDKIGYPVVLKVFSSDIVHKSDIGGVKVDLKNAAEVKKAYNDIMVNANRAVPGAHITGVQVTKMVSGGFEVIIGVMKDPSFGPMVMFGMGGIYVEVLKDVSFRIAPVCLNGAREMIQEIKMYPLLKGVRGQKGADLGMTEQMIQRVSQLVCDFPEIMEMDINPLKVFSQGEGPPVAIDARVTISLD